MKLPSTLRALGAVAAAATAVALATSAQAAPIPQFTGETPLTAPTFGTVVSGEPLIESTTVGDAGNVSGIGGFARRGSDRQLLLDVGFGNTVFGAAVVTSWSVNFTSNGAEDYSFAYNFVSNLGPTDAPTEFFQVQYEDTQLRGFVSLVDITNANLSAGSGPLLYGTGWQQVFFRPLAGNFDLVFQLGTTRLGCGFDSDGSGCIAPSFAVISDIPEPATLALVTLALGGTLLPAAARRRRETAALAA